VHELKSTGTTESTGGPWLSVIVPSFNGAKYLRATLQCLVDQTCSDFEVLVIDDRSTDGSLSIIDEFKAYLPIRLLAKSGPRGWTASCNQGLREAGAPFVSFLHQDDIWAADRVAVVKAAAQEGGRLIIHPAFFIGPGGDRLGRWRFPLSRLEGIVPTALFLERLLVHNFITVSAPAFDRNLALAVGGLQEDLWFTADWLLWMRLGAIGPVRVIGGELSSFRLHRDSLTISATRDLRDFRWQHEQVWARFASTLPTYQGLIDQRQPISNLSLLVNEWLASTLHGTRAELGPLLKQIWSVGIRGVRDYVYSSRIIDRTLARVRLFLKR